jgi:hypothetical protein
MDISDYLTAQMREALGPVNRWFCAQHFGRDVNDTETLLRYYIKNGGAKHFAQYAAAHAGSANAQPQDAELPLAKAA